MNKQRWWYAALIAVCVGCSDSGTDAVPTRPEAPRSELAIVAFCGACHPMPDPASFTKDRWHHEVRLGINLYRKSQRTDLVIPDVAATQAWFEKFAPETLSYDTDSQAASSAPFDLLRRENIPVIDSAARPSGLGAISHVIPLSGDREKLALADMRTGKLWIATRNDRSLQVDLIGSAANPAHIEPVDFDQDGIVEYLVADLGGFFPLQTRRGSLWWFQPQADGSFKRVPLRMGMMRTSDVRAGDFDQDGDLDLVVAEFGMHFQGGIYLMINEGMLDGVPQFRQRKVDERAGGIHVPVVDLNGDGRLDFVALISQHHEAVVAFINQGDALFSKETIYAAGDPAYGSSGIELVDMDGDDDLDVLYSNGDTFDDAIPKPSHSIQWLENQGAFPFVHHRIGKLPGAYRAVASDVDQDGDLDIAAVALLNDATLKNFASRTFDGVILFEQTDANQFTRHSLQSDRCDSAACLFIDWDHDGDSDLVTFPFGLSVETLESISLFRNGMN